MSLVHQFLSVALLLLQVGLFPYLIGVDEFGVAVLVLSPLYFAQALAEPVFQACFNKGGGVAFNFYFVALSSFLMLIASIGFSVYFLPFFSFALIVLLVCFLVSYVFFTAMQSALLANDELGVVVVGGFILVLTYSVVALVSFDLGYVAVFLSGFFGFFLASLFYFFYLLKRDRVCFSFSVFFEDFGGGRFIFGTMSFRLPVIIINNGFLIIMGLFAVPTSTIATVKILVSAAGAGRYANLVPLALLQARLAEWIYRGGRGGAVRAIKYYLVSFSFLRFCSPELFTCTLKSWEGSTLTGGCY